MSNRNLYGILTNGEEDEDEVGSLHTISDDSINDSTVQAIAEEAEGHRLDVEIALELKVLNTELKQARQSTALSTIIDDEEDFDL